MYTCETIAYILVGCMIIVVADIPLFLFTWY